MKGIHRIALAALCVLAPGAEGQEELGGISGGQAISSIVAQSRIAANDVIRGAGGEFGRGAFTTRQNAEILLTQLDLAGEALQGKHFDDLSDVQRAFFVGTRNAVEDMRRATRYSANKARMLSAQADSLLDTIPGANGAPRMLDFSPRYLLAPAGATTVGVVIDGSWLGSGDPTLSMSGRVCQRTRQTDARLAFNCDVDAVPDGLPLAWITLRLAVFRDRSWWESTLDLFRDSPAPTRYEVGIAQIPRAFGHFAADARVPLAMASGGALIGDSAGAADTPKDTVVPIAIGDMAWGTERSIDLPDRVSYLTLRATLIDGVDYEDSSADAHPRRWYTASIDLPHRKLVIRSRDLETALSTP
jgi:hypothetical protein